MQIRATHISRLLSQNEITGLCRTSSASRLADLHGPRSQRFRSATTVRAVRNDSTRIRAVTSGDFRGDGNQWLALAGQGNNTQLLLWTMRVEPRTLQIIAVSLTLSDMGFAISCNRVWKIRFRG